MFNEDLVVSVLERTFFFGLINMFAFGFGLAQFLLQNFPLLTWCWFGACVLVAVDPLVGIL